MAQFILDTDISSYVMKRADEALWHRLQSKPVGDVCISAIAMSEFLFGVEISPRRQENQKTLNAYLRNIEILYFPVEVSVHYAEIRAHLRKTVPRSVRTISSSPHMLDTLD